MHEIPPSPFCDSHLHFRWVETQQLFESSLPKSEKNDEQVIMANRLIEAEIQVEEELCILIYHMYISVCIKEVGPKSPKPEVAIILF